MRLLIRRLMAGALGVISIATVASCAAPLAEAPLEPRPHAEAEDAEQLSVEIEREERELTEALAGARCEGACAGGGRLCELAARLCEIAERHPSDVELEARCQDGAMRCEHSRTRIEDACQCDAGGEGEPR